MTLYRVTSYQYSMANGVRQSYSVKLTSDGFSSRAAAERFAAGLSASGQCHSADIEAYEADDEE